jgi:hypothetical protein
MRKKILFWSFAICLCCPFLSFSQMGLRKLSATVWAEEHKLFMAAHKEKLKTFNDSISRGMLELPLKIHIVRKSDASGSVSVSEVEEAVSHLNQQFLPMYTRFTPLEDYNYLDDDKFYAFNKNVEAELCDKKDINNVINIYIVGTITGDKNNFCAYTYPPSNRNKDRIIIAQKCFVDKASLIRQMAHYFSLYPTHGPEEEKRSAETVDGKNCKETGDEICDTPADPKLDGRSVDGRCDYIGQVQDGTSKFYRPMIDNFVCDNPRLGCVNKFTRQQYARMLYAAINIRNYLQFPKSNKKNTKALEAEYGIDGEVIIQINSAIMSSKLERNLYKATNNYSAGSVYKISINNNKQGYIYILEGDSVRGINLVYPQKGDKLFFDNQKHSFTYPKDPLLVDNQHIGTNYICVLFSKKQLPMTEMIKKLNALTEPRKNIMQKFYMLYGGDIVASHYLNYDDKGSMKVSGLTNERTIAPVWIEYKQD